MKKFLFIVVALFAVGSVKAQDETQLGYWNRNSFVELAPDESFIYKFIQAMDDESQEALNDLFTDMKGMGDNSILKRNEGGWYVKKDYPLPEGNYYESAFYRNDNDNGRIYIILPRINVLLRTGYQIEDLLDYYGDKVTLESSRWDGPTDHYLNCHMKTSTEVLEAVGRMYELMHEGIIGISPDRPELGIDYDNYLISVLTGSIADTIENGEKLVYEMNWEGKWPGVYDGEDTWQGTDEGMAITTSRLMESMWDIRSGIGKDITIVQGHYYIVRLTLKVPSDGSYNVGLGNYGMTGHENWDGGEICSWCVVPVTASEDFQVIDAEFPNVGFSFDDDAFVYFDSGWVVGTTIVKKVEVYEKFGFAGRGDETAIKSVKASKADESIYNLAGQKVNASYKGVVIKSGKKMIVK